MLLSILSVLGGPSDDNLVARIRDGDLHAFSALVRRYQDRVYGLCLRWLGDGAGAEDTAQEVFVALYRSLDRFRGESSLSTWIFRITVNHCKNRKMSRERRAWGRHVPLDGAQWDEGPERQVAADGPWADAGAEQSHAEALVRQGLEALSEEHRQVIVLRDIQDLDYDEIAAILDLPRGTVKSRLHRARAELARVLRNRIDPGDVKV